MSKGHILEVRGLETHFRTEEGVVRAVDGVSFHVDRGEVLGIVGESGSGKSVTSLSLLRLVPDPPGRIVAGELWLEGANGEREDLARVPETRMRAVRGDRIAMIFQDPMTSLNPYLRIGDQLAEVLTVHRGAKRADARRQSIAMLESVGIPAAGARVDDYPHQLSGGMRQRVMIAMALLCEPDLLLADEPTTALDVTIQAQILELVRERKEATGMGVVLITHDLGVVAGMADRVLVMYAGKIVEEGPVDALFDVRDSGPASGPTSRALVARPRHPYTIGLARSIPRLDSPRGEPLMPIPGLPPSLAHVPSGCAFHPRCPHAMPVCVASTPELRVVDASLSTDAPHRVRCHLEIIP